MTDSPKHLLFDAENNRTLADKHRWRKYPEGRQAERGDLPLLDIAQRQCGGWLPTEAQWSMSLTCSICRRSVSTRSCRSIRDVLRHAARKARTRVCTTTPCWLRGSTDIVSGLRRTSWAVQIGETTDDGVFSLWSNSNASARVCNAPVVWIDDDYYEDVDRKASSAS